jgi:hypothetical protein
MDGKGPIEASFESARSAGWSFPAASRSIWQVIVVVIGAAFIGPFIAGALGYANSNGGIPVDLLLIIQIIGLRGFSPVDARSGCGLARETVTCARDCRLMLAVS